MACYYPVDAWRSLTPNESGKYPIVFNPRDGAQDSHLQVPCGKCVGCSADRALMWSVRIYHEASLHEQNSFLTLTYADPAPEFLCKKHLQDFFKRARHSFSFRYFAVGEYGSSTHRPHYHAVIFGQDFLGGAVKINDKLYTNPILADLWGHGMVSIGNVELASCCYVAGYTNKKVGDPDTFSLMSRRPGIGHDWLDKYKDDLSRTGTVTIEGREFPVPQRYFDWDDDDTLQTVKDDRKLRFSRMSAAEITQRRNNLRSQEINRKSKLSLTKESI